MIMAAPQLIVIGIMAMSLGISLAKHGVPRENHSVWVALVSLAITSGLLAWGGFWT